MVLRQVTVGDVIVVSVNVMDVLAGSPAEAPLALASLPSAYDNGGGAGKNHHPVRP